MLRLRNIIVPGLELRSIILDRWWTSVNRENKECCSFSIAAKRNAVLPIKMGSETLQANKRLRKIKTVKLLDNGWVCFFSGTYLEKKLSYAKEKCIKTKNLVNYSSKESSNIVIMPKNTKFRKRMWSDYFQFWLTHKINWHTTHVFWENVVFHLREPILVGHSNLVFTKLMWFYIAEAVNWLSDYSIYYTVMNIFCWHFKGWLSRLRRRG